WRDTPSACLMRLARAVHSPGLKVGLTGEGADEALAGYAWFKTQAIRDRLGQIGLSFLNPAVRSMVLASMRGNPAHVPPRLGIRGVRTAQQDVYDLMAQGGSFVYSADMWRRLAGHLAYDDLDITNDRFPRAAPLDRSVSR